MYLLEQAKEAGVDAEILATENRELSLESFGGELAQVTQATQGGIGVRVVTGGKTGYASSEERSQGKRSTGCCEKLPRTPNCKVTRTAFCRTV